MEEGPPFHMCQCVDSFQSAVSSFLVGLLSSFLMNKRVINYLVSPGRQLKNSSVISWQFLTLHLSHWNRSLFQRVMLWALLILRPIPFGFFCLDLYLVYHSNSKIAIGGISCECTVQIEIVVRKASWCWTWLKLTSQTGWCRPSPHNRRTGIESDKARATCFVRRNAPPYLKQFQYNMPLGINFFLALYWDFWG